MTLVELERERLAELLAGHEHTEFVQTGRWPEPGKTVMVKYCSDCPYTRQVNEKFDAMIAGLESP